MKGRVLVGWQPLGARTGWANPRPPAAPAELHLSIEEYFAAAALMGLLASQGEEPDMKWAADWAAKMGTTLAKRLRHRGKQR